MNTASHGNANSSNPLGRFTTAEILSEIIRRSEHPEALLAAAGNRPVTKMTREDILGLLDLAQQAMNSRGKCED